MDCKEECEIMWGSNEAIWKRIVPLVEENLTVRVSCKFDVVPSGSFCPNFRNLVTEIIFLKVNPCNLRSKITVCAKFQVGLHLICIYWDNPRTLPDQRMAACSKLGYDTNSAENIYILLTKREGRTGRISARGLDSTDRAQRLRKALKVFHKVRDHSGQCPVQYLENIGPAIEHFDWLILVIGPLSAWVV